jgi:uncharacterized metal-binding protein
MSDCAKCGVQACRAGSKSYPTGCPTTAGADLIAEVEAIYERDPETRRLLVASAQTEAAGYCRETRVEEIMSFARRIGAQRLGVAHCVGLAREASLFEDILKAQGFEVHTICCKVGSTPKEQVGLKDEEKVRPGQYEAVCSPVAQAKWLNRLGTQLNVLVGLCVGHDSLFFRNSDAPVTVLVVKDRVTGHNPVAALYTSHSYYKRLKS